MIRGAGRRRRTDRAETAPAAPVAGPVAARIIRVPQTSGRKEKGGPVAGPALARVSIGRDQAALSGAAFLDLVSE